MEFYFGKNKLLLLHPKCVGQVIMVGLNNGRFAKGRVLLSETRLFVLQNMAFCSVKGHVSHFVFRFVNTISVISDG